MYLRCVTPLCSLHLKFAKKWIQFIKLWSGTCYFGTSQGLPGTSAGTEETSLAVTLCSVNRYQHRTGEKTHGQKVGHSHCCMRNHCIWAQSASTGHDWYIKEMACSLHFSIIILPVPNCLVLWPDLFYWNTHASLSSVFSCLCLAQKREQIVTQCACFVRYCSPQPSVCN